MAPETDSSYRDRTWKLVLDRLDEHSAAIERVHDRIATMRRDVDGRLDTITASVTEARIEVAALKAQARTWGGIAGFAGGILAAIVAAIVLYSLGIP